MSLATARKAPARAITPEEFGELFDAHADWIYSYLFRRTADWALAEDLTSVVFLEAWRRRQSVDLSSRPALPWLCGVATNVLRNQRRALRRYRAALQRVPPPEDTPDFAEELAGRLDDQQRMGRVLAALGTLSREDQDVIALCAWQGLSYEDAATALEVPVGTVRSRLSRARARLLAIGGTS